jgi:hypothetical protein
MTADLNLKRPDTSPSGECGDHDFDVLADDVVVGRIMKTQVAPRAKPWFWGIGHKHLKGRSPPTYGYEATRGDALAAFGKSWRLE